MALPYWYTGRVYTGFIPIAKAIEKQTKLINLKPVKKIKFSFDPFDEKAAATR